jgi:hypothetical protein
VGGTGGRGDRDHALIRESAKLICSVRSGGQECARPAGSEWGSRPAAEFTGNNDYRRSYPIMSDTDIFIGLLVGAAVAWARF